MFRSSVCLLVVAFAFVSADKDSSSSSHENDRFNRRSLVDTTIDTCLSTISTRSVDVLVDIAPAKPAPPPFGHFPFPPPPQKANPIIEDVSNFVEAVSRAIPKANFYTIVIDGKSDNQTRYYLNIPNDATQKFINRPLTMRTMLNQVLYNRTKGGVQGVPTTKNASAPSTIFTVVITDGFQQTPVSAYPDASSTAIIDVGGNFTLTAKQYRNHNVLLSQRPNGLKDFEDSIRLQICQAVGGIQGQTVPVRY